jgi:drug/metabolite transporter (DMT)-like permease
MNTEAKEPQKETGQSLSSWITLIFLTLIWGSSYILMKKGLVVFTPMQLASLRITFAFIVMLWIAIYNFKKIPRKKLKIIFIAGLFGNFFPAYLYAFAQTNVSSSLAGIVNSLTPLFTLLIALTVVKLKVTRLQIIGIMMGFAGCVGLSLVNNTGGLGQINIYIFLIVVATFFYGININLIKAKLSDIDSLVMTSCAMMFIGPFAIAYLVTTDFVSVITETAGGWEALGYVAILGITGTAMALFFFNRLIQNTGPVFASTVTYLMPVVAVIWGVIDGETLFPLHFVGMALIIMGVYITNKKRPK